MEKYTIIGAGIAFIHIEAIIVLEVMFKVRPAIFCVFIKLNFARQAFWTPFSAC